MKKLKIKSNRRHPSDIEEERSIWKMEHGIREPDEEEIEYPGQNW